MKQKTKRYRAINLLSYADEWFKLYKVGLSLPFKQRLNCLNASHCCLLFALEFYLKALLAFCDKRYEEESELIRLDHNFKLMIKELKKIRKKEVINIVKKIEEKLGYLIEINPIELRYPPLYSLYTYSTEINPELNLIFEEIRLIIKRRNENNI